MNTFKIGDSIERIKGDAQNRGIIIEIDEAAQRARIDWTHYQRREIKYIERTRRCSTVWFGEFYPFTTKQPRTWAAFNSIKVIA
jgi:hypothetical protein